VLSLVIRACAAVALSSAVACAFPTSTALKPAPVVRNQTFRIPEGTLQRVAVLPFQLKSSVTRWAAEQGTSADTSAELVARFVTEALMKRGISVVAPSDVATAIAARGNSGPIDTHAIAELAAEDFGATAVLVGRINRYRERQGEKFSASEGASVAFQLTLYTAPGTQRVWTSSFDETQRPLGDNVWNAPRYPGGGTRWLSATELATWGANSSIESLPRPPLS
jgi:hypothetical protein